MQRVLAQIKFVIQIIIAVEKINIFTNLAKYIFNYSKIRFCDKFKLWFVTKFTIIIIILSKNHTRTLTQNKLNVASLNKLNGQ